MERYPSDSGLTAAIRLPLRGAQSCFLSTMLIMSEIIDIFAFGLNNQIHVFMKKIFIVFAFILGSGVSVFAQDLITKKDGTDIQAKILEVTSNEVKYKKFSNLEGPTFTLPKSDILIVRYENGENEVFNASPNASALNTSYDIYPGMHYRDYKDYYNTRDYVKQPGDSYSPFWIGFGDFIIPGLGNAITGEWGRAAAFFFSNIGLGILALDQMTVVTTSNGTYYEYSGLYWAIVAARLGLNVWSICDAVHVAKAKNMYFQDLRAQRATLDFKIEPFFSYAPTGISTNTFTPTTGLTMKLNF